MIVDRDHIGFFGKMNSGKSTLMNLITQQCTSIVDDTPGTTADTKFSACEIHGLGPVKLYDTAGIDERAALGEKKRAKVFSDLKECDLVVLVVNPATQDFSPENELLEFARDHDKQVIIFYNLFSEGDRASVRTAAAGMPLSMFYKNIAIDAKDDASRIPVIDFIRENFESKNFKVDLLPNVVRDGFYILNIPMDVETPGGRYLRPQAMCEEFITRNWAFPVSYRMDLASARSHDPEVVAAERGRFDKLIAGLGKKPELVITDSQAMDVAGKWVPKDILITTFSIVMINYMSRGRLKAFVNGALSIGKLKSGDKILIVEACN
ncbi:MAG TPA: 50S ribosome-binding GTPase, partial [bacterium]|nr:50S ribosome-binding GTPase [bacterium]